MIEIISNYSGAGFRHTGDNCTATGDFRVENGALTSVNVNGQLEKGGQTYNFWANRDASGNVNISGVPASVLTDVAGAVADIIAEVEGEVNPNEEQ